MGARRHGILVPARTDAIGAPRIYQNATNHPIGFRPGPENILSAETVLALFYPLVRPLTTSTYQIFNSGDAEFATNPRSTSTKLSLTGASTNRVLALTGSSNDYAPTRAGVTPFPINAWNHAALTWDGVCTGTNLHAYAGIGCSPLVLDDGSAASGTGAVANGGSQRVAIGGPSHSFLVGGFSGFFAYVARWNRELSLAELLVAQAHGPQAVPDGLVFYWSCGKDRGRYHCVPQDGISGGAISRSLPVFKTGLRFPPVGGRIMEWSRGHNFYTQLPKKRGKIFVPARTDRFGASPRNISRLIFPSHPSNVLNAQTCLALIRFNSDMNSGQIQNAMGSGTGLYSTQFGRNPTFGAIGGTPNALYFGYLSSKVGDVPLDVNQWHHIAMTWDATKWASGISLYTGVGMSPLILNGASYTQDGFSNAGEAAGSQVAISGTHDMNNNAGQVNGSVAYVARWNRILTHAELLIAQAHGPKAVPDGLVFYYSCGKDRGPLKLPPSIAKFGRLGKGPPFPNAGGRIYEWRERKRWGPMPVAVAAVLQYLRPISDVASNGWLPSSGPDLYPMLDESVADDADYIYSPINPTTEQFEVRLTAAGDPGVNTSHVITLRFQGVNQDTNFDVDLVQNTTVLDSWTENVTAAASVVERSHTLSGAVADSITDYTNLRIRGVARA